MALTATPTQPGGGGAQLYRCGGPSGLDVVVVVFANVAVVVGFSLRHGGVANSTGPGGAPTAVGQLTGLLGDRMRCWSSCCYGAACRGLEHHIGLDGLAAWHRWVGSPRWISSSSTPSPSPSLRGEQPGRGHAPVRRLRRAHCRRAHGLVGTLILVAIAISSIRRVRAALELASRGTSCISTPTSRWRRSAHQLAVGSDFVDDPLARAWWVVLYGRRAGRDCGVAHRVAAVVQRAPSLVREGGRRGARCRFHLPRWADLGSLRAHGRSILPRRFPPATAGGRPTRSHCRPIPMVSACA